MKFTDVPPDAHTANITPVPTKAVVDLEALFALLTQHPFIVLEVPTDDLRTTANGTQEAPIVKSLITHANGKRVKLATKRLTHTRWVVMRKD